jgi:hypothetical protein
LAANLGSSGAYSNRPPENVRRPALPGFPGPRNSATNPSSHSRSLVLTNLVAALPEAVIGAARYSSALETLDLVLADARASGRADLVLRAEGLRSNVLSRLGAGAAKPYGWRLCRPVLPGTCLTEHSV